MKRIIALLGTVVLVCMALVVYTSAEDVFPLEYWTEEEAFEHALSCIDETMSDVEKVLALHEYLAREIEYNHEGYYSDYGYGEGETLIIRRGVCGNYAFTYQYLLDVIGIENHYVTSDAMNHAWNLLKLDGNWYHVDVTWDASTGLDNHDRRYFLKSDDEFVNECNHYDWEIFMEDTITANNSGAYENYIFRTAPNVPLNYFDGYWYYLSEVTYYGSDIIIKSKVDGSEATEIVLDKEVNTMFMLDGMMYGYDNNFIYEFTVDGKLTKMLEYVPEGISDFGMKMDKLIYLADGSDTIHYVDMDNEVKTPYYVTYDGIVYNVGPAEASVTEYVGSSPEVIVKDNVDGVPVVRIENGVFELNDNLEGVVFPNTVRELGYNLFWGCTYLESVVLPDNVDEMGSGLFSYCYRLQEVNLPKNITEVPDRTFHNCRSLEAITIPSSVNSVAWSAFEGCDDLTIRYECSEECWSTVNIEEDNDILFENPIEFAIDKVTISENTVTATAYSGGYTMRICSECGKCDAFDHSLPHMSEGLQWKMKYYNNNSVTVIGYSGNSSTVFVPSSIEGMKVTEISDNAFKNNTTITEVIIEDGVTSIGYNAFSGCSSLEKVTIPESVKDIYSAAFYNCTSLESITLPKGLRKLKTGLFANCTSLKNVDLPGSLLVIGYGAFDNSGIENIEIPETTIRICESAFEDCENLPLVSLGSGLKSIGERAFSGCSSLTSIIIPDSVTSIGNWAFSGCSSLTSIIIPDSVTTMGDISFSNCEKLESIIFPENMICTGIIDFHGCSSLRSIVIPNGVTSIGDGAFSGCSGLTSITIPNSVTVMGDYAFEDCTSLKRIKLPNSITHIGNYVFNGCTNLTNITIPESVTSIGDGAFRACASLISIRFPESVQSMGNIQFYNCKALTTVVFPNNMECTGFISFYGCSSLESIIIPQGILELGDGAFCMCTNLTTVTIPKSIKSIGKNAFLGCSNITDVYYDGTKSDWQQITIGSNNNAILSANIIYLCESNEHSHLYQKTVTSPTCTTQGYTTYTCVCGNSYVDNYVSARGHNLSDWFVVTLPTTSAMGVKQRNCKNCNYFETTEIPKKEQTETYQSLVLGEETAVTVIENGTTIEFIPLKSGEYIFTSIGYDDVQANLIVNGDILAFDDDSGELNNFSITYYLEAGQTYYLNVYSWSYPLQVKVIVSMKQLELIDTSAMFIDVKQKSWFREAVDYVVSNGLMNGMTADTFEPNTTMSRAMLVTVLWRLDGSPAPKSKAPFTDLKQAWYKGAVAWAYENKIVTGTSADKFSPNGDITREQMAAILYRYSEYRGEDTSAKADISSYPDANKVSKYARDAFAWANAEGLITGTTENGVTVLAPRASATRAQVAIILQRFCEK